MSLLKLDFKNCNNNNNLITCENSNRSGETYAAYIREDSQKMGSESGRNMSEN